MTLMLNFTPVPNHILQSGMKAGSRVLAALDRFALRAYNEKEQPELNLNGLSESQICMYDGGVPGLVTSCYSQVFTVHAEEFA